MSDDDPSPPGRGLAPLDRFERLRCAARAAWILSQIRDPRPPVPHRVTPKAARDDIRRALALGPGDRLVDIGCGTAETLIDLVTASGATGVGLELDPALAAEARRAAAGTGVQIVEGDFADPAARAALALGEATVVLLFLLPWAVAELGELIAAEMDQDARLASYTFADRLRARAQRVTVSGYAFEGHRVPPRMARG